MLSSGGGGSGSVTNINQLIWRVFTKTHGLTLQTTAVEYLKERLGSQLLSEEELVNALTFIATTFKKQQPSTIASGRFTLVDADALSTVIEGMLKLGATIDDKGHGQAAIRTFIHVINSHQSPRWDYEPHQKLFFQVSKNASVLGNAESKIEMFTRRYEIIKQRLLRAEEFSGPNGAKIISIKAIKGQRHGEKKLLLGMLSYIDEGRLYLEDPEDFIKLDLDGLTTVSPSFYVEGSIVIVGGIPNGDIFRVEFISSPPIEDRSKSISLSHPNHLIGSSISNSLDEYRGLEKNYLNTSLVILSDVWLDCPRTMNKLSLLFRGFIDGNHLPAAFIIMGSLLSPNTSTPMTILPGAFSQLATMLQSFPMIQKSCKFIFLPSLEDPFAPNLLPRPSLPTEFLQPFHQDHIDALMVSNPCRLYCFSREILLYRNDASISLRKNLIPELAKHSEECNTSFRTILEQAHLSPLPILVQSRAWELDHTLTVYPSPNYLVISEHSKPAKAIEGECIGINPGSFATADFSFTLLYPLMNKVELWYTL